MSIIIMILLLSLLILSVSIVSATVEAKEISVQKATDLACYYVNQKTTLRQGVSIKLAYTAPSSSCRGLTDYYAFNVGDNQGFILVSAVACFVAIVKSPFLFCNIVV